MLGKIDLTFEHYAVTIQTSIDCYPVIAKMFLKSDEFWDPCIIRQIDAGRLE